MKRFAPRAPGTRRMKGWGAGSEKARRVKAKIKAIAAERAATGRCSLFDPPRADPDDA